MHRTPAIQLQEAVRRKKRRLRVRRKIKLQGEKNKSDVEKDDEGREIATPAGYVDPMQTFYGKKQ